MLKLVMLSDFICLDGGFPVPLGPSQKRLVAAVAAHEEPLSRDRLASDLFPETPQWRARARLRQLVFRLHEATGKRLLDVQHASIALASDVEVDYHAALGVLRDVQRWPRTATRPLPDDWQVLRRPLLSDIDVACVEPMRNEWDVQRGQALEAMAETLLRHGTYLAAVEVGDVAAEVHEFREAPRRIAIEACLRVGEIAEAHMRFRRYERLLGREVGVSPSPVIPAMLRAWQSTTSRAGTR
ncbi:BTAD domain-containing putative transcriptional regulator [Streptomyces sp. NPDC052040]|uniref:AfsR/SARP family transcriptional regulator n=1 Tax=Streptomyces sp. NPDC052040 TaxID=3365682 RepID=UPI0037CEC1A6